MSTYSILAADDETTVATATSRRDAERIARRVLGVRRMYRSAPSPLDIDRTDDGWRHAGRAEGCASVRIVRG